MPRVRIALPASIKIANNLSVLRTDKLFAFSLITTVATAKHDYVRQTKFGTENVAGWLNETQDAVQGNRLLTN